MDQQQNDQQLDKQVEKLTNRVTDQGPDWVDILKKIFGKWQTWVAIAAVGGGVAYYTSNPVPADISNNQSLTNTDTPNPTVNLDFTNDEDNADTVNDLLKSLVENAETFQNVGLENTQEIDIPISADSDMQSLIDIYERSQL